MVLSTPAASMCFFRSSGAQVWNLFPFEKHAQRMLDGGAHGGNASDVVERGIDDVLGVREDQAVHTPPLGFLEDDPGLADVEMSARERHVVFRDDVEDLT